MPTALERPGCVVSIRPDGWYGRVAVDPCGPILPYERVPAHPLTTCRLVVLGSIKNHQVGVVPSIGAVEDVKNESMSMSIPSMSIEAVNGGQFSLICTTKSYLH